MSPSSPAATTTTTALALALTIVSLVLSGCTEPSEGGVVGGDGPGTAPSEHSQDLPYDLLSYRTPRDTDAHHDVPTWRIGDVWEYEIEPAGWEQECVATDPQVPRSHDEVVGAGARENGVEVYRVRITSFGCQGETQSYQDYDYSKAMLAALDEQGRWLPKLVFPLEDGKRWRFDTPTGDTVTAEATWLPDHRHDGRDLPAWRIELDFDRPDQALEIQWFGEAVRNLVRQEIHRDADGDGATELRVTKRLVGQTAAPMGED